MIDLSTYRRLSWEKNLPFFLVSFIVPETGDWLAVDPRSALKVVLDKAEEKGWTCMSGAEFEVCLSAVSSLFVGDARMSIEKMGLTESTFNSKKHPLQWTKRSLSVYSL